MAAIPSRSLDLSPTERPLLIGMLAAVATIVGALLLTAGVGGLPAGFPGSLQAAPPPPSAPLLQGTPNPYVYSDVAERAVKSVVSITTSKLMRGSSQRGHGQHPGGMWGFGPRFPQHQQPHQQHHGTREGAGSGVIIAVDGTVLTNNHVIAGADRIRVELADRRTFDAKVVGTDPKTDIAVLKLQGKVGKLDALPFADSDKVRLGEIVLAIGNSFGRLQHTVTQGIVSAKGRGNVGIVEYEDFIQTDAAINPGNSGGALVNMRGELVGINTAIASRSGGSQGVGFAIPANMVGKVMRAIVSGHGLDRGFLGVMIQDMDDDMAAAFSTGGKRGVLIGDVQRGSPAEKAGLQRGDVVLAVDGKPVQRTARLRNLVSLTGSGKTVVLGILRSGKASDVKVKLGSAPGQQVAAQDAADEGDERIGLALAPVDDRARQQFGLNAAVRDGAVVADVRQGSHASAAGLRQGDVIEEVDRKPVATADDAIKRLRDGKDAILVTVRRGASRMYLVIRRR